jgi:hypothetical protein
MAMNNLGIVLLVFAFVCAVLAALWPEPFSGRIHLGWLAVTFWVAAEIFGGVAAHLGFH